MLYKYTKLRELNFRLLTETLWRICLPLISVIIKYLFTSLPSDSMTACWKCGLFLHFCLCKFVSLCCSAEHVQLFFCAPETEELFELADEQIKRTSTWISKLSNRVKRFTLMEMVCVLVFAFMDVTIRLQATCYTWKVSLRKMNAVWLMLCFNWNERLKHSSISLLYSIYSLSLRLNRSLIPSLWTNTCTDGKSTRAHTRCKREQRTGWWISEPRYHSHNHAAGHHHSSHQLY